MYDSIVHTTFFISLDLLKRLDRVSATFSKEWSKQAIIFFQSVQLAEIDDPFDINSEILQMSFDICTNLNISEKSVKSLVNILSGVSISHYTSDDMLMLVAMYNPILSLKYEHFNMDIFNPSKEVH